MPARNSATVNKTTQSPIATDFDRLIVDIAACDDWDMIDYYHDMLRYLEGLAQHRKATIEAAGFGAFLSDNFKKRFDTKDQAHEYLIKKIAAIHDCDEDEINWEDHDYVGYCRYYWVGEKSYFPIREKVATIQSVDDDNKALYVFRSSQPPPVAPDGANYQSIDEATQKLSSLVQENQSLKSERWKRAFAWDEINRAKILTGDNEDLRKMLDEWLRKNKDLLRHEPIE